MAAAIRSYFEFWNIIDLLVAMLSMVSLILMAVATDSDAAVDIDLLRCFQATAGLLGGIKLLSFLRGLDFSAFLISMLEAIVADMVNFFAVLLVIMVSCVRRLVSQRPHASLHHLNLHVCVCLCAYRACACSFAYAFFLLLQDSPLGYPTTSNSTVAQVRAHLCCTVSTERSKPTCGGCTDDRERE
eukprot:COSAG06_NODE_7107_length_2631_cov_10.619273_2_plen_186_part_00